MSCSVYLNYSFHDFKHSIGKFLVSFQKLNKLKAELLIIRISSAFIGLFIYLYNMVFIVSYISLLYNRFRIVRRGWDSLRF